MQRLKPHKPELPILEAMTDCLDRACCALLRTVLCGLSLFLTSGMPEVFGQQSLLDWNSHRFTHSSGLNSKIHTGIVQDAEGFIWVATERGLYRYDGTAFEVYDNSRTSNTSGNKLLNNNISSLNLDCQDRVWASFYWGGMSRYVPATDGFESYEQYWDEGAYSALPACHHFINQPDGPMLATAGKRVFAFSESENRFEAVHFTSTSGEMLAFEPRAAHNDGSLWGLHEGTLSKWNLEADSLTSIAPLPQGMADLYIRGDSIVVASPSGSILVLNPQGQRIADFSLFEDGLSKQAWIYDILLDRSDRIWCATSLGLHVTSFSDEAIKKGALSHFPLSHHPGSRSSLSMVLEDVDGRIWFASRGLGLHVLEEGGLHYTFIPNDAPPSTDNAAVEHRLTGGLSVMIGKGAMHLKSPSDSQRVSMESEGDFQSHLYRYAPAFVDDEEAIFLHGQQGVSFLNLRANPPELFHSDVELKNTKGVVRDHNGAHWWSRESGVYKSEPSFIPPRPEELQLITENFIGRLIDIDSHGNVWAGSWAHGVLRIDPATQHVERYDESQGHGRGLRGINAHRVCATSDGGVWVHTSQGLHAYDRANNRFDFYGPTEDFPIHQAVAMVKDAQDRLWFSFPEGLLQWDTQTNKPRIYNRDHGLPDALYTFTDIDRDQVLTAYLNTGVVRLNAQTVQAPPLVGQVYFKRAKIGRDSTVSIQGLSGRDTLYASYMDDYIKVDFTALELGLTGTIRYAYRIGEHADWVSLGSETSIRLVDPPLGKSTLMVRALNNDGIPSDQAGTLVLDVRPPFWLTIWAYFLYAILAVLASFGYTRLRTAALRKKKEELEFVVTERTREIAQERDRSDELLLNILPEKVAEELKQKGTSDARLIDEVTVLFTDFKGFTALSEELSPEALVHDLNVCFSAFDEITSDCGIEKIKTIGDAYMAAGGLPTPNRTHASDVLRAALHMRDFVLAEKQRKTDAGLPYFEVRIGVHTGPVVAGIVGVKKFQYDIWGDTVNTASRMESSGAVGKVNISQASYAVLKDDPHFIFEERGAIEAKGKGKMEMWFASRAKPQER